MPPTGKDWPISARAGLENGGDWLDRGLQRWYRGIVDEVGGWMAGLGKVMESGGRKGKDFVLSHHTLVWKGMSPSFHLVSITTNTKTIIPILPAFRSLFINDLFCYTSSCSFFFLLASFKNILVSSLKKFLTQPHVPLQLLPYVSLTIHSKTSRELPTLTVFPSAFTPLLNCSHRSRKMTSINITRITSLPELIA